VYWKLLKNKWAGGKEGKGEQWKGLKDQCKGHGDALRNPFEHHLKY
jgi:hypothetical protein